MADNPQGEMPNPPSPAGEMPPEQQPTTAELLAELSKTRAALKSANSEAADRRKKLEALELAETERKAAEMTDLDKAKAEAAAAVARADAAEQAKSAAEARALETALRAALGAEAIRAGIDEAELTSVWREFRDDKDLRDKVEAGDDDSFTGLDKAVKAIVDAHPRWLKADAGPRKPPDTNSQRRGAQTEPALDEIVRRKRSSGNYSGI